LFTIFSQIPIQGIATTKEGLGRIQISDSDVLLDVQAELCSFVSSGFEQIAVTNMPQRAPTSASADVKAYFEYDQTAVSGINNVSSCFFGVFCGVRLADEKMPQRLEKDAEAVTGRLAEEEPESERECVCVCVKRKLMKS
jgi:hypothetical protein